MVKNDCGGSHAKKQGRKYAFARKEVLRVVREEGEVYAVVTRVLGGGMVLVETVDRNEYLCLIRSKFRGRSRRDNAVVAGTWVMVGLRLDESRAAKQSGEVRSRAKGGSGWARCDLLEVYTSLEFDQLKVRGELPAWAAFTGAASVTVDPRAGSGGGGGLLDNFEFSSASAAAGADASGAAAAAADEDCVGEVVSALGGVRICVDDI